jgi:hypothetical protein
MYCGAGTNQPVYDHTIKHTSDIALINAIGDVIATFQKRFLIAITNVDAHIPSCTIRVLYGIKKNRKCCYNC